MNTVLIKILRRILFNTVLVVILLHTFIPHPHSDEMTKKEHIKLHNTSNSLYSILKNAFHESNDESLDNLIVAQYHIANKTKHTYPYPTIAIKDFYPLGNVKTIVRKRVIRSIDNFNKLFIVKLNGERGPPFLV
ncbi:hypothetical protein MNBD_BACTEROID02-1609 [hydrothermal vent metagenome]|jgi:urate oxidase|uniref:Uncharacterized protein n=1 Tax=hydrothermal vent metagenome TaxID=652676 RepID=A0A3B0QYH5_9ZZZZ